MSTVKGIIFNDKENTGQSSPSNTTTKRTRRPLQELSSADMLTREYFEFTSTMAPTATRKGVKKTTEIKTQQTTSTTSTRQTTLRSMR